MRRVIVVAAAALATGCAGLGGVLPKPSRIAAPQTAGALVGPDRPEDGSTLGSPAALEHGVPERYSVLRCIRSPEVDEWERRLEREEAEWRRMLESSRRGGSHYRTVRRIVAEEGLPSGLALLPAIESGYRAHATGPTGARGLWQFGAGTARSYGLVVNGARDDRLDVELSTRAALRHLRDLRERYGTWPLALAAYNAGEGRVRRAIASEGGASFWRLAEAKRLPPVTRTYVPKFLALVRLMQDAGVCPPGPPSVVAIAE